MQLKPLTKGQAHFLKAIKQNVVTICTAPAGTGKTYLGVGLAAQMVLAAEVEKIIFTRPLLPCGEHLGFLPGMVKEKIEPYFLPMLDYLSQFIGEKELKAWQEKKILNLCPLALMRGLNFENCYVISDESQNATLSQLKMLLTRVSKNSKLVVVGDITQSDITTANDFSFVINKLYNLEDVAIVNMGREDIVRSEIVKRILERLP